MPEQEHAPLENESENENGKPQPIAFDAFGKQDRLATVSWYLVTTGIIILALAALCLFLGRSGHTDFFKHKDFAINPIALSRYLLLAGLISYAAGRSITYYRRFRKREPG